MNILEILHAWCKKRNRETRAILGPAILALAWVGSWWAGYLLGGWIPVLATILIGGAWIRFGPVGMSVRLLSEEYYANGSVPDEILMEIARSTAMSEASKAEVAAALKEHGEISFAYLFKLHEAIERSQALAQAKAGAGYRALLEISEEAKLKTAPREAGRF